MANLLLKNINKIYDNNVQAVFDFGLEVNDKEFVVFVGPSGCGKSTTLRMIAGLEEITSGQLFIDNVLMNNVVPKERDLAMVFQSYALYPHMSVYENMAFTLELNKTKFPLLEENPKINALKNQINLCLKKVKQINKKMTEENEAKAVIDERNLIYQQIYEYEHEINKLSKVKKGINTLRIKELDKLIKRAIQEIKASERLLNKSDEQIRNTAQNEISEKNILIEKYKEERNYLLNNEVELYEYRKMSKMEIDLRVNHTADIVDLTKYLFRKPSALSGGQRQRVALGRAIVRNPKVFLMDEPLSNLDAKLRVQMRNEILKIHKKVDATTIYVTHDQVEAMTMADKIVVMNKGYIQQIGAPKEIYNDPTNTFVASFIGTPAMNLLHVYFDGNKIYSNDQHQQLTISLNDEQKIILKNYINQEIILGIRPEHIGISNGDTKLDKNNSIKLNCDLHELLGSETVLYFAINEEKLIVKLKSYKAKVKPNQEFSLFFDLSKLYFFEKEKGMRIK